MTEDVDVLYSEDRTRRVRVVYDELGFDTESPLDSDPGFEVVVPSRARFTLSSKVSEFQEQFDEFNDRGRAGLFPRWLRIFHGIEAVMLYRYEHSAVAYSVASFRGRAQHAEWDSGPCGFMYFNPPADDLDHGDWFSQKSEEERMEVFEKVAESLTDWANGWVYGLIVEELRTGRKVYDDGSSFEHFEEWDDTNEGYFGVLGHDAAMKEAAGFVREEV